MEPARAAGSQLVHDLIRTASPTQYFWSDRGLLPPTFPECQIDLHERRIPPRVGDRSLPAFGRGSLVQAGAYEGQGADYASVADLGVT